jgi:hypothetical protein
MSSTVLSLLEQVRKLPELQQRKISCLLGAAVADAAARPLHWIYDLAELNAAIKTDVDHPGLMCLLKELKWNSGNPAAVLRYIFVLLFFFNRVAI